MDGQGPLQRPYGRITSGIEKSRLALQTINFVRQQLPAWRDDPDRRHEKSEPRLNLQLCKFLERRARNDFPMVQFVEGASKVATEALTFLSWQLTTLPTNLLSFLNASAFLHLPEVVKESMLPEKKEAAGFSDSNSDSMLQIWK